MLNLIRTKQKSFIIKVVFWSIIAAFVGTIFLVWGKGSSGGGGSAAAVTVNGQAIGFNQYETVYNNMRRLYQNIYGSNFTPQVEKKLQLRKQALNAVVEQTLLEQQAKKMGLSVSRKELVSAIAQISAFQVNGVFNRGRYLRVLSYQRMTASQFEAMQKEQMLVQQARTRLEQGVSVNDKDVIEAYRKRNTKVDLAFARFVPSHFESRVKVTDKALQSYFANHGENFRVPEQISLNYLLFDPASYTKTVTFKKNELDQYYRRHLAQFETPEELDAAHILIKVPKDAPPAVVKKKRALAEKILKEARAGKNFAALARRYSQDPGSAAKGGELGYFPRGVMVPSFEKAAFALRPGQISDLVRTPFGFHIIKVEGYHEAGVKPLAKVLKQVKQGLIKEKSTEMAMDAAMRAYSHYRATGDLKAAAKDNHLQIQNTNFFSRGESIDGFGQNSALAESAFALDSGELARPIITSRGVVLFALKKRLPSHLPKLADVRTKVEEAYRKDQAQGLAHQAAQQVLKDLQTGKSFAAALHGLAAKEEQTGLFNRSSGALIPQLGNAGELAKVAFTLTEKKPVAPQVYEIGNDFVVARLIKRQAADMKELTAARKAQFRQALLQQKREEAVNQQIQKLRAKAEIKISPSLENSMEG